MEFLTIELRPQIRSGYVYTLLQPDTHVDNVRITKNGDSMTAKVNNKELLLNFLPIEINSSVTSLQVLNKWIVFRIQLNQSTQLDSNDLANNHKLEALKTNIDLPSAHESLKLVCTCCHYSISKNPVAFKRVLSLPSEECEPSEWFCCSHSDLEYKNILCPRTYDCFYGSHFYVLNRELLSLKLVTNKKEAVCKRCLSVVGIVKDDGSFKIWSHCIKFTPRGDLTAFKVENKSPLVDFKIALKEFVKNGNLFEEVHYFAAEQGKRVSLFIKIMDKNLSIMMQSSVKSSKEVTLEKKHVIKVLYKFSDNVLMNSKEDSNRSTYQLSLHSINAAVDHLTSSSLRLPPIYRFTDSYCIGYVS